MRVTVEQIDRQCEEELIVRCYDPSAEWGGYDASAEAGRGLLFRGCG